MKGEREGIKLPEKQTEREKRDWWQVCGREKEGSGRGTTEGNEV